MRRAAPPRAPRGQDPGGRRRGVPLHADRGRGAGRGGLHDRTGRGAGAAGGQPALPDPPLPAGGPADGREARERARAQLAGRPRANRAAYHAVPGAFGRNREAVRAFTAAWNTWVSAGEAVYASSAAGREILAEHFGTDPTGAATARRMSWS
ncbi:hypothetical protein ACFQXA_33525 [Nocardiopsis composta]